MHNFYSLRPLTFLNFNLSGRVLCICDNGVTCLCVTCVCHLSVTSECDPTLCDIIHTHPRYTTLAAKEADDARKAKMQQQGDTPATANKTTTSNSTPSQQQQENKSSQDHQRNKAKTTPQQQPSPVTPYTPGSAGASSVDMMMGQQLQIVGMSATLPNVDQVGGCSGSECAGNCFLCLDVEGGRLLLAGHTQQLDMPNAVRGLDTSWRTLFLGGGGHAVCARSQCVRCRDTNGGR